MSSANTVSGSATLREKLDAAAAHIHSRLPAGAAPRVGLVLGSGLGAFADRLEDRVIIPYSELPGFPTSTVVGHASNLVYGRGGKPGSLEVLVMHGRVHYYEGHSLETVVHPVRTLIAAGCSTLIVTNASGGINTKLRAGDIVIITDHLNMLPASPLRGPNDESLGPRFPDMSDAYDPSLRSLAARIGRQLGTALPEGVYACSQGPAYETPAEIRMLRSLGADLAGMSTVPEVIAARHMGARVLGLSCVTNLACGLTSEKLTHAEVTETATRVRETFIGLLEHILGALSAGET